jgi:GAF domain-containing protein
VLDTLDWIPMAEPKVATATAARNRNDERLVPARGSGVLARMNPVSPMQFVVERASTLMRADGAALATWQGNRMVCQASAGTSVPDIGTEVDANSGLAGLCVRTGQVWRCDDATSDRNVNVEACRELGIRSVIAAPLNHLNKVLGILQVLSSETFAFDDRDVATVQLLSQVMVMAFARKAERRAMAVERGLKLSLAGGFTS